MKLEFSAKLWYWRDPAPWYFVTVPAQQCHDLKTIVKLVTYGWGMIPVHVRIGESEWTNSMWNAVLSCPDILTG